MAAEDTAIRVPVPPVDLDLGIKRIYLDTLFATGDDRAHQFDVQLMRGGKPVALPGDTAVKAFFVRYSDNVTILMDGVASGHTASVTLNAACYKKPGAFALSIKILSGSETTTVFFGEGSLIVSETDSIIDPDQTIPSLSDLLAQIEAMKAATEDAKKAAQEAREAIGSISQNTFTIGKSALGRARLG